METSIILISTVVLLVLLFLKVPVFISILSGSMAYFYLTGGPFTKILGQRVLAGVESIPLLAIPFFICAGVFMNYSGVTKRVMGFCNVMTGRMTGGLAQVNVLLSTLMGGLSGSNLADAAMEAKMLVPEMEKRGYSKGFSAAITAASSAVTPVIPPGINLIVYALIAGVSVGKIFMAGYMPGIFMAICLMITVNIISKKRHYAPSREKRASAREIGHQAIDSIWALLFPFGIILGLRIGLFTPSEAGAVAVLYCIVIGAFVYKNLRPAHIPLVLRETIEGTSTVVLIIVAANVFGYYMSWERIPQMLTELLLGITQNKYVMLMIINVLLLVLGMFLEGGAALIILAPLLVPVVKGLGVDLVHFGLVCIVNIMIGGLTPPFGSMMFTCCSITGCELTTFVKECIPFIIALLVALLIVTYVPILTMFIPNLLY